MESGDDISHRGMHPTDAAPERLRILVVEPVYGGSRRAFVENLINYSQHEIVPLTLPARFWKWRMRGAHYELARMLEQIPGPFDLVLAGEMLNLPAFLGMARHRLRDARVIAYFHTNQLNFPLPPWEKRDVTLPLANLDGMLAADEVWFNTEEHRREVLDALPRLLRVFPEYRALHVVDKVEARSRVVTPGIDLRALDAEREAALAAPLDAGPPVLLWNSRWDYDKRPDIFFAALRDLVERRVSFRLALAGTNPHGRAPEFEDAREQFAAQMIHYGQRPSAAEYARLLWRCQIVVSTAEHEYFPTGALEAMYCDCVPVLPSTLGYPAFAPGGYLYRPGEVGSLADHLTRLLRAPTLPDPAPYRAAAARFDIACAARAFDAGFARVAGVGLTPLPPSPSPSIS
jgi:glycosyltransferase involved in cell wall biosynthesis